MRREEGGGFRMGNTCIPVADSCCIWQNQYNIVKLKNKIKLKQNNKKRVCLVLKELAELYSNVTVSLCIPTSDMRTKIMASGPTTSWQIDGETMKIVTDFIFGAPKSLQMVTAAMKLKDAYFLEGKL